MFHRRKNIQSLQGIQHQGEKHGGNAEIRLATAMDTIATSPGADAISGTASGYVAFPMEGCAAALPGFSAFSSLRTRCSVQTNNIIFL
ncbi:MAG: hypothetical protein EBY30_16995 [Rhodospirillales bacterium]|nr:hypothetical protein [Rhodospirillales bacterium]